MRLFRQKASVYYMYIMSICKTSQINHKKEFRMPNRIYINILKNYPPITSQSLLNKHSRNAKHETKHIYKSVTVVHWVCMKLYQKNHFLKFDLVSRRINTLCQSVCVCVYMYSSFHDTLYLGSSTPNKLNKLGSMKYNAGGVRFVWMNELYSMKVL